MQISSKLLIRTAIIVLGLLLALSVFVAFNSQSAKALDSTQWDHVRGYVYSYFNGATSAGGGDEAGLIYPKATLMHNLGGDTGTGATDTVLASYVGEGDDMANKPILIDNLMNGQTTDVPGTEFRCQWNTAGSCFGQPSIDAVKAQVDAHKAAGFSTDIIDYCATSHTASPTTAGWGIIAQTGALSSSGDVPKVSEMWFSRCGWNNSCTNPPAGANTIAAPESSAGGFSQTFPTSPSCSGTDADVVRCTADWAISLTGGNTGNGTSTLTLMTGAGQSIDVRPGSIQTLSTAGTNLQLPLDSLFSTTSLAQIDPTKTLIVASKTQHGGQAAMGLRMLGYPEVHDTAPAATGGYINGGIYRYSSVAYGGGVPYTATGDVLPQIAVASLTAGPGVTIDTNGVACPGNVCQAPVISSPSATATGYYTADVSRTVNKPATSKIDLTGSDSSVVHVNDTVLHANNTEHLTGLHDGVTYTGTLTVYDSNAISSSTAISFTTPSACTGSKPDLRMTVTGAYWASFADYSAGLLSVKATVNNAGTEDASNVTITGATADNGVTLASGTGNLGSITAGNSANTVLVYNVPTGVTHFYTNIDGSAQDHCGNSYTYGA